MAIENTIENKYDWEKPLRKLTETLKRNERRFELIQELDRAIQRTTDDSNTIFEILLNKGLKEIGADYGHIMVKASNKLEVKYSNEKSVIGKEIPLTESLCGKVFESRKSEHLYDVNKERSMKYFCLHERTKSELTMPILDFKEVKVFGILNIEWEKKTKLTEENLRFCELLNRQLAIAMEQIKIWQGVKLISELSNDLLVNSKSPEEVYKLILHRILNILDFELGQILLVNNTELLIVASSNAQDVNVKVSSDDSVCGFYVFNKKGKTPLIINDLQNSEYKDKYKASWGEEKKMGGEFVFPLVGNENNIIGVINIEDPRINAFSEFDVFVVEILGKMISSMAEASSGREKIKNIASARGSDLIFAQMGHLSLGFLHNFGGAIGNAKARLSEFKRSVTHLDELLPKFSGMSALNFIEEILDNLRNSEALIHSFRDKLQPENLNTNKKQVDLLVSVQNAIGRAEINCPGNISINLNKDNLIDKRKSINTLLTEQFDEVLDVLLNNAMEAMPNGGKIEVTLKLPGIFTAEISIADAGIGMDDEMIEKIFDFGFSTKDGSIKRKGQGLGLWLAKVYLTRFGAELIAESEVGKGSTFFIKIPIVILDTPN